MNRTSQPGHARLAAIAIPLLAAALLAPAVGATGVKIFRTDSQPAFLAGNLEGIGIDSLGRLRLADRVERLTAIGEPFLLSAAAHPDGWVVGTGNAGKVLLVDRHGGVKELFAAEEPEIFAVWVDPDGTVWAGSSPDGKVYRIPAGGGAAQTWFDPGETYIWSLRRTAAGALLVATGTQGKLFRVTGEGEGEVVYDSDDTHLRALALLPDGQVMVGTAGEGLVQLLTPAPDAAGWRVRTLYDADEPEVVAFAVAPDGTRYAAVVASESSRVALPGASASAKGDTDEEEGDSPGEGITITVSGADQPPSGPATPSGSRRPGYHGPRSEVLSITPAGVVESLWSFDDETVFDLLWHRGRLWVGTGLDGELYSWNGSQMVLEKDVDERQVVALLPDTPGPAFATTNASALFRVAGGSEHQGTYTSAALDAEQIARFGTFRWRGEVPRGAGLSFSFRSGISSEPDRTWSPWSEWTPSVGGGAEGGEVGLGELSRGRYAQWRARFESADGATPLLYGVELSYRQENLRPKISALDVLDPGEILVPANFNPGSQTFEPASPSRDSIFTTLEPASRDDSARLKPLWKPGYRSLTWKAADDNDDELVYRLAFRPAGDAAESPEAGWMEMTEELDEDHYSFDATVLPDGVYRFRLQASDAPDNPAGEALVAERTSEPVVVDHTPPRLAGVTRSGRTAGDEAGGTTSLRVTLDDELSPLRQVQLSVDAGEWRDARPDDGLLDGRGESFTLEVPAGAHLVLLRAVDAAYNGTTFDLGAASR